MGIKVAILVSFGYNNSTEASLHGYMADLIEMYEYCHKWCDVIYCLTDADDDSKLQEAIKNGIVKRETNASVKKIISNNLDVLFDDHLQLSSSHAFVYYSGHGTSNGIICPDGNVFEFKELINRIPADEVFWLIDSCEAINFPLPFENNQLKTWTFTERPMMAMLPQINTVTSKNGSKFSSLALEMLRKMKKLADFSNVLFKTSHVVDLVLPYWIGNKNSGMTVSVSHITFSLSTFSE